MNLKNWNYIRPICAFLFILFIVLLAERLGIRKEFSVNNIKLVFDNNIIVASLMYICFFSIGNILQIPGWIFLGSSIYVLGKMNGYCLTLIAAIVSVSFSYFLIKLLGGSSLRLIENKWVVKLLAKMDEFPIRINIFLRLIFQTAPPLNYSLALSGVSFKSYLIGAILGLPIPVYIYTFFIDYLMSKL